MSSKHRVVVLKIIAGELSATEAADQYGVSRQYLHKLLARYRDEGLDGLDARSRAPLTSAHKVTDRVRERIAQLRAELTATGTDAGPVTIAWHLQNEGLIAPSTSTIRRILHNAGLITPEPRKRPRSSYIRFEASQPNETWQSDFTHSRLADGTDTEIVNWLDDHSRLLLSCTAHRPVTGRHVVDTFLACIDRYGPPASTLTDNGRVYTARHGGGRNEFEYVLAALNIRQKNGAPNHPQTQGKVERFHQTLKRWLTAYPRATSTAELQAQLDAFREHYNTTAPTAPAEPHRPPPTSPPRKPPPPDTATSPTTASATTTSTPMERSASVGPDACTTSASASHTAANDACSSLMSTPSPLSTSTPAKSSRPTPSAPTRPTGATTKKSPADGRALPLDVFYVATQMSPMSRLITMVDLRGFEPLTSSMRTRRATNCATGPETS